MRVIDSARRTWRSIVAAAKRTATLPRQFPHIWAKYRRRIELWLAFALTIFVLVFLLGEFAIVALVPVMNPRVFGGPYAAVALSTLGPLGVLLLAWKLNPRLQALIRRLLQRNHTSS